MSIQLGDAKRVNDIRGIGRKPRTNLCGDSTARPDSLGSASTACSLIFRSQSKPSIRLSGEIMSDAPVVPARVIGCGGNSNSFSGLTYGAWNGRPKELVNRLATSH